MIVPQYWAEARVQHRAEGRQVTLRRFGWSDESQAHAQAHADARATEALQRLLAGDPKLPRREPKLPYNGAQGVPIREEIVARHGNTIITRNAYGARCLNTPDVLFADIDFAERPTWRLTLTVVALLLALAVVVGWLIASRGLGIGLAVAALLFGHQVARWLHAASLSMHGGAEQQALQRVRRFSSAHPDWALRVYRTPSGLRVLATHRLFSPDEPAVAECLAALGADPLYTRMCLNQHCFRARVSAKPWRIGIAEHMKPRPGVWPVAPERLPARQAWIERYETAAAGHAACRFVERLGSTAAHVDALAVQALHDELCGALGTRPLA